MTTYEERPTQEETILKLLKENTEISSLDIVLETFILQYNARIWGLRQKWYEIKCDLRMIKNKFNQTIKVWYYRLENKDHKHD